MWPCRKTVSSDGVMVDLSLSQRLGKDTRGFRSSHSRFYHLREGMTQDLNFLA